jgi:hypothetical protein
MNTLKTVGFWVGEILAALSIFAIPYMLLLIGHAYGLN